MTPVLITLFGGTLTFLIWSVSASRVSVARALSLVAVVVSVHFAADCGLLSDIEAIGQPVNIDARGGDGQSVSVDVVIRGEGTQPRAVRRITVSQSVPASGWMIILLLLVGAGGILTLLRQEDSRATVVLGALVTISALMVCVGLSGPSTSAGAESVRALISDLGLADSVDSFSVPTGGWTYSTWGLAPAIFLLVLSLVGLSPRRSEPLSFGEPLMLLGGIIVVGAVIWNTVAVGGFVWSGADGALCLQAVILAAGLSTVSATSGRGSLLALSATLAVLVV
jgi:hypothetical protein